MTSNDKSTDSTTFDLARAYLDAGLCRKAIQLYRQVLNERPDNAVALLLLGLATHRTGDESLGNEQITRSIAIGSGNGDFCAHLGYAYRELGRFDEAIASFQRAFEHGCDEAVTHVMLGDTFSLLGRHSKAESAFRNALRLKPDFAQANQKLGISLQRQDRIDSALTCFRRGLRMSPIHRWQVIQFAIARLHARTYLEIGVELGCNLEMIWAPNIIGVDPLDPLPKVKSLTYYGNVRYFPMTSDAFFAENHSLLNQHPIDVAFIDGKHTYAQSRADVEHCLQYLSDRGIIFMHDCNPTSLVMATPASSMDEVVQRARENRLPGWRGHWEGWTGDVWKTVLHLRSLRDDLNVCVLDCDFGIGVISKTTPVDRINRPMRDIDDLTYTNLEANRQAFLGLREPDYLLDILLEATGAA